MLFVASSGTEVDLCLLPPFRCACAPSTDMNALQSHFAAFEQFTASSTPLAASVPRMVNLPLSPSIANIGFGDGGMALTTVDGELLVWGNNSYTTAHLRVQREGCDPTTASDSDAASASLYGRELYVPTSIPSFAALGLKVVDLACGPLHTLLLTNSTHSPVFSWGCGDGYRLGHGDTADRHEPTRVAALGGLPVRSISTAACHSLAVVERSTLMQLLHAAGYKIPPPPTASSGSAALAASFNAFSSNAFSFSASSLQISVVEDSRTDFHAYTGHSCVAWGSGLHGQLGLGNTVTQAELPAAIPAFEELQCDIASMVCQGCCECIRVFAPKIRMSE